MYKFSHPLQYSRNETTRRPGKTHRPETQLIQQLRQQPQLARPQSIRDPAETAHGPIKVADAVETQYAQPARVLPTVGAVHVIAKADGTTISTDQLGPRKGPRPPKRPEMGWSPHRPKTEPRPCTGPPSAA